MKVAQFLYSGLGGHGSVAFSLVEGDHAKQWSNAFGFVGIEPLLEDYRDRCARAGIEHAYFPAREGRPWTVWSAIFRWLHGVKPDAILCHGGPALAPSAFYARRHDVPLIVVEHTSIPARGRSDSLYSRLAMRVADAVVVLTEELAAGLRASLGSAYRSHKVAVIANGVNTDRFDAGPRRTKRKEVRIGMAGRLTDVKLHDQLIEIIGELVRLRPDCRWVLSFAGDGPERERLEKIALDAAPGVVEFRGVLPEHSLAEWYRSLDIYAHASKAEALSTAILQAMATELPVVASDVPGIAQLLIEDVGVLVSNGDLKAWTDAISKLVDTENGAALGRHARQLCLREYSHRQMHEAYDALIRRSVR